MVKTKKTVSIGWRTTAIILGIILLLFISLLIYGVKIAASEKACVDYCFDKGYESYTYDFSVDECSCYTGTTIIEQVNINR